MSTITSPGSIRPALIASMASDSRRNTRAGPLLRYTPSGSTTLGSMDVLLTTDPPGAKFPRQKVIVLVSPRERAVSGSMMTSSGSTPSCSRSRRRRTARRSETSQASSTVPSVSPVTVRTARSSNSSRRKCSITSGTPPARNTRTVGCMRGPLGRTSTRRGTRRLTSAQSSARGRRRPAA